MSHARSSIIVGASAGASRVLGFVRDVLFAQAIGAGPAADAFLAAFRSLDVIRRLMSEGGLNPVLVPTLTRLDDAEARRFAGEALAGLALVVAGLTAAVEVAAGLIMLALAPGLADDQNALALATLYARLAWPLATFASLSGVLAAALNARGSFRAAALAPLVVNLGLIGALLVLPQTAASSETQGAWLAAMLTLTGALQFAILLAAAAKRRVIVWQLPRFAGRLRELARSGFPVLAASLTTPLMPIVALQVASFEPAGVARFYYADRLVQLPISIVGVAVGAMLLPQLARSLAAGARDRAVAAQNLSLAFSFLIAVPAATGLAVLAGPIATILFERGAFDAEDARGTAQALVALSLGLPFAVIAKTFAQTAFARGATGDVLGAGIAALLVAYASALLLGPRLGLFGIGLGVSMGYFANAALLAAATRRAGLFRADRQLVRRSLKVGLASAVMAGLLFLLPTPTGALSLAALCLGAALSYAAAAWLLGAITPKDLSLLSKSG